jgi:hypothetical protein
MNTKQLPSMKSTKKLLETLSMALSSNPRPSVEHGNLLHLNIPTEKLCEALQTERYYQNRLWDFNNLESRGLYNHLEFITFIQSYVSESIDIVSRKADPKASIDSAHNLRRIAALALASLEINLENNELSAFVNKFQHRKCLFDINIIESLSMINTAINESLKFNPNILKLNNILSEGADLRNVNRTGISKNDPYQLDKTMYNIFYIAISAMLNTNHIYKRERY